MMFPLNFEEVSLFLAIMAMILLATSGLLSPEWGKKKTLINEKKLKKAAVTVSGLFIATVALRIIGSILIP
jgi:nitrate reductase gamma subunit